jgi:hypothetical protein
MKVARKRRKRKERYLKRMHKPHSKRPHARARATFDSNVGAI